MQEKKLQFIEGTSSKFWNATQDGVTLTVVYGRIGSAGQTQLKTFASETEAASAFLKLVAEKEKKGYTSSLTPGLPPSPRPAGVRGQTEGVDANPPRQIKLTEADRRLAGASLLAEPLPRPPAEPFDQEACLARLEKIGKPDDWSYYWKWEKAALSPGMSREEAAFWWDVVMLAFGNSSQHKGFTARVRTFLEKPRGEPELKQLASFSRAEIAIPVFVLFGVEGVYDSLKEAREHQVFDILVEVEKTLLPYLTAEERTALRERVAPELMASAPPLWALRLSGVLGAPVADLTAAIARLADGSGKPDYYYQEVNEYLRVALCLQEPDRIASELRRLQAYPRGTEDIRVLLAATELRCLDLIVISIQTQTAKAEAEKYINALALAEAPEVAPYMLDLVLESKAPHIARQWLEEHPAHATEGLLLTAAGQGKKADAAVAYLRGLKKRELGYVIEAKLDGQPESVVAPIRERVLEWEEATHEPLTDDEAPEWVKVVFGGALSVPDLPADENPPRRLLVEMAPTKPLPAPPEYQPLPPAPPFDLEACLARLLALHDGKYWQLHNLKLALPMSREEAHFWVEAIWQIKTASWKTPMTPTNLEGILRAQVFGEPSATRAWSKINWLVPIWVLFGMDGVLTWAKQNEGISAILPHLSPDERQALKEKVLETLTAKGKPLSNPMGLFVALEQLGASLAELEQALHAQGKVQTGYWWSHRFFPYVLRLATPEKIVGIARALSVYPATELEGRAWLAATGWEGVERLSGILEYSYYDKSEAVKLFALVEAPEMAYLMATHRKFPSTKLSARSWLDRLPAFAVEGLAPLLIDPDKKKNTVALEYLRELKRKGLGWLIAKKLPQFDEKVQWELRTRVLDYDPRKEKAAAPRDTALATLVPPVLVKTESGLRRLTLAQTAQLLAELRTTPLIEPSPTLELVRQSAEKRSLDTFVWALFEGWLQDSGPSKDRWKMEALGHLGGDAVALKLTPLIRTWPGESQHQRAVLGLDCLRAIGTDTALMQINGIAEKVSFKGIKERAKEAMEAIATERNFTRDELSDRIIPDGGLDSRGSRVFDFGPRQFAFVLSAELKPMVRGDDGKRLPDLPKPNTKDDPEKAADALAAWKLLKKQVAEIAKSQAVRLEQAMVVGRRWTPTEFTQLFVSHPVMVHLVRRLIWCAYDESGAPLAAFRVADDSTLADESDDLWELPKSAAKVGIVHPSHLTPAQQATWGEVFADYEIIPPFVQLGRPTYPLTDDERVAQALTRFKTGVRVEPKVLIFGLENLGWIRGTAQDGGCFTEHYKTFDSAGVTAVVNYEGEIWMGDPNDWDEAALQEVYFVRDANEAMQGWTSHEHMKSLLPLGEVDPVIVSEVLHDLTRLYEKGKKG